jgi:hypothetical protein
MAEKPSGTDNFRAPICILLLNMNERFAVAMQTETVGSIDRVCRSAYRTARILAKRTEQRILLAAYGKNRARARRPLRYAREKGLIVMVN